MVESKGIMDQQKRVDLDWDVLISGVLDLLFGKKKLGFTVQKFLRIW